MTKSDKHLNIVLEYYSIIILSLKLLIGIVTSTCLDTYKRLMTNSKVYFYLYTPYYNLFISAIYVSLFILDYIHIQSLIRVSKYCHNPISNTIQLNITLTYH